MTQQGSDRKSGNILEDILFNGQLAWKLVTDPRVSLLSKVLVPLAGVVYILSPVDLIPEFIPVLGQLDDVAIILLLVRLFIALAPQDIVAQYRAAMGHGSSQPKGKRTASPGADDGSAAQAGAAAGAEQANRNEDIIDADFRVHE
jgi:uncharacterized membrane protein YkvA (DUF1232 family)